MRAISVKDEKILNQAIEIANEMSARYVDCYEWQFEANLLQKQIHDRSRSKLINAEPEKEV